MSKRESKRRFSALISEKSHSKVSNICKTQEIVNTKITPGTVLELGLLLLFRELENGRPLEDMIVEYLTGSGGAAE